MKKNHLCKPLSIVLVLIMMASLLSGHRVTVFAAPIDVNDYAGLSAALAADEAEINFTVNEITLTTALPIKSNVTFTSTAPQGYTVLIAASGLRHFTVTSLTSGVTVDFGGTMSGSPGSLSFDHTGGVVLDGQDAGGGIAYTGNNTFTNGIQLHIVGAEIRNCNAENGGAININRAAPLVVEDSLFESNTAINNGGAIFCNSNTGNIMLNAFVYTGITNYIYNSKFAGNSASYGGAVRGYLSGNNGSTYRSVIYAEACEFRDNEASNYGGAISMNFLYQLFVDGSAFHDNIAPYSADYLIAGQPLTGKQAPVITKPYNVVTDTNVVTRLNRYVGYVMAYGYQSVRSNFTSGEYSLHYADNGDQQSTSETDKDNWNIYYGYQAAYGGNPGSKQIYDPIIDTNKYTHIYNNADVGYLNVLFVRYTEIMVMMQAILRVWWMMAG